jgi:hypothetical protein
VPGAVARDSSMGDGTKPRYPHSRVRSMASLQTLGCCRAGEPGGCAGEPGEDPVRFGPDVEFIMDQDQKQTVATLAAAIVIARGAKSVAGIRDAWADANWIINPVPSNSHYKLWREKHGDAPTTSEGD